MKSFLVTILLIACCHLATAQDNLGIAGSSRSPVNTVLTNPSTLVDSRAFIDINLIGLGIYVQNNFAYLDGKSFSLKNISNINAPQFNRNNSVYNVYADAIVHGPSATFAIKSHAFGIYTAARTVADVRGITKNLGYHITESFQYAPQMGQLQSLKNVRANGLAWGEVGFNYGTILARSGNAILQGGITAKRLLGVSGIGLRLDEWTYAVQDSVRLESYTFKGEYGFNDPTQNPSYINGKGWGFDFGLTYKMRKSSSDDYVPHSPCTAGDYLYRIGFSILDIGRIKFNGPIYTSIFNTSQGSDWNNYNGTTAQGMEDLDSLINNNFNIKNQGAGSKFRMKLPTALSVQADYNMGHNFYLYGALTYGLPRLNSLGVERASYIGIAPRWEIKRFEVALPLSLYEWTKPQVGAMFRINSIIIGSDNLGWLLFNKDIYGADIYFNFKYTIFKHWKCGNKKEKKKSKDTQSGIPCPSW